MKKVLSLLLCAALLCGLLALPAAAADFTDITDARTAENVATLRLLGVVDGVGNGKFQPNGTLTRAQFCKMAEVLLGSASLEPAYRSRTIFPDVRSTHWARGWVNLAAAGETKIIAGMPDGTFRPDSPITYAQAVTILVRMLGYTDADAGNLWPSGFLELGAQVGLNGNLSGLGANSTLTRAQAAQLFCNLLAAKRKEGGSFLDTIGTSQEGVILALNVTMDNGQPGGVRTSAGTFEPVGEVSTAFVGRRGTLVLDDKGRLATFLPEQTAGQTIVVATSDAGWITDADGVRYLISGTAPVYTTDGENRTFADVWMSLPGASVTLYSKAGKVEALFWGGTAATEAVVVTGQATAATFATITGGEPIRSIYKNGRLVSYADLKSGDVATFSGGVLNVSDTTITGFYENASPNPSSPETITVMGCEFPVLPAAWSSIGSFRLGSRITLRLTANGAVAAVEKGITAEPILAVVQSCAGSAAKLTAVRGGFQLSGSPELAGSAADNFQGQLVCVTSSGVGRLRLTQTGSLRPNGAWNIEGGKLGSLTVSPTVKVYEQVRSLGFGNSAVEARSVASLALHTIPAEKIYYYHKDADGVVDAILLDDATGDCYTYGYIRYESAEAAGEMQLSYATASVENYGEGLSGQTSASMPSRFMGGLVASATKSGFIVGHTTLTAIKDVPRAAFTKVGGATYFSYGGTTLPVAEDVQCQNSVSGVWFESLDACRAFSNNLTVYYDAGGKVRVVTTGN